MIAPVIVAIGIGVMALGIWGHMRHSSDSLPGDMVLSPPEAVRVAWVGAPPKLAAGQIWRACNSGVTHFVLVLMVEPEARPYRHGIEIQSRTATFVLVAPITLDMEMATEEASLLNAGDSDFAVPIAVWLPLRRYIPRHVMDRYAGDVRLDISAIRQAPTGPRLVSALEDQAMEVAVIMDDMDELARWIPLGLASPARVMSREWEDLMDLLKNKAGESMTTTTREQGTAEPLPTGVSRVRIRESIAESDLPALDLARLRDDIDGPLHR